MVVVLMRSIALQNVGIWLKSLNEQKEKCASVVPSTSFLKLAEAVFVLIATTGNRHAVSKYLANSAA